MCVNLFFVKHFSGPTALRILKFGTNAGYDLYCVRENQLPPAYHSIYLSFFSVSTIKFSVIDFLALMKASLQILYTH